MSTCQCGCSETGKVCYCIDCDLTFKCEDKFNNHIDPVHMFKCDLCGVRFIEESELKYHIQCYCRDCDLTFKCEDELDNHINQVHMFKCDLCGVYEFEESELRDHIEEHHGSSLEPPAEANDDKHEEEVDKASTDEEHTNDGAL